VLPTATTIVGGTSPNAISAASASSTPQGTPPKAARESNRFWPSCM
jgi:hypothetical protein